MQRIRPQKTRDWRTWLQTLRKNAIDRIVVARIEGELGKVRRGHFPARSPTRLLAATALSPFLGPNFQ